MRVAVAGATGKIGSLTVDTLRRDGHDVIGLSRSLGVDLVSGIGLDGALVGVRAVIDVTNAPAGGRDEMIAYFATSTRNVLAAEQRAGVGHHVLLSIVGLDRAEGNAHYAAKREQERLVTKGAIPWTIVPAAHFHDFAGTLATATERDGVATVPPMLVQPIAQADIADVLAEIATDVPKGRYVDVAGPEPQDLVDLARRTAQAKGQPIKLIPSWSGPFGVDLAGNVALPGDDARLTGTTFEEWLASS